MKGLFITRIALFSVFLLSCGKDQTVDDYNRQKAQRDLALFKTGEGIYTGYLLSSQGVPVGALQMRMEAHLEYNGNTDASNSASPVLVGALTLLRSDRISITTTKSLYDPESGTYQAKFSINRASGLSETISLDASLRDGHFSGKLYVLGSEAIATTFDLLKDGPSLNTLISNLGKSLPSQEPGANFQTQSFVGKTRFLNSGIKKPVRVVFLQTVTNLDEDLLNILSSKSIVQMSLNYNSSVQLLHPNAVWDLLKSNVVGQFSLNSDKTSAPSAQMSTVCNLQGQNLKCHHTTTQFGRLVATTDATLDKTNTLDPSDSTGTEEAVTRTYVSDIRQEPWMKQNIKIIVTYPQRSVLDNVLELFFMQAQHVLQVSVLFDLETGNVVAFREATWNSNTGVVDANSTVVPDGSVIGRLRCQGFYFTQTRKPFWCEYSTNRSKTFHMNFRPPFRDKS